MTKNNVNICIDGRNHGMINRNSFDIAVMLYRYDIRGRQNVSRFDL